jgi:hypothetical protein
MTYDAFLAILTQLAGKKQARVVIQGSVIFIETQNKREQWTLKTKVFDGEGFVPKGVRDFVTSSGVLRWQERGAYLQLDSEASNVYLVHDVESSKKYVPFRYHVNDFVQVANEWKDILDDFSERDHTPTRIK